MCSHKNAVGRYLCQHSKQIDNLDEPAGISILITVNRDGDLVARMFAVARGGPVVVTAPGEDDIAERASRAAQLWRPGTSVSGVQTIHGGASSLTYRAELNTPDGAEAIVVKMAPAGVEPVRNRDVLRQSAILKRLQGYPGIRTPRVLFEQSGESLALPPFFAMEFIPGECIEPILDDPLPTMPSPDTVRARALEAVRMLAVLHSVPTDDELLEGEKRHDLHGEIARWERAMSTVEADLRPYAEQVCSTLTARVPAELPPVLLHGDFRLGNMLCERDEIRAVIDWEIWGMGDPRIDLQWFLLFTDPVRLPTAPRSAPGMPTIDELVGEYSIARAGDPLRDLDWFDALIQLKQAAVTALIVKHNRRRSSPDPRLERSALQIEALMLRALTLLG
jgi:aminoglycoside phosphotransferase (APT) family kinase protein